MSIDKRAMMAEITPLLELIDNKNSSIASMRSTYQDLQYKNDTAMDAEEQNMATVIRECYKDGIRSKTEGIRSFQLKEYWGIQEAKWSIEGKRYDECPTDNSMMA
jgi:hypothetical protein